MVVGVLIRNSSNVSVNGMKMVGVDVGVQMFDSEDIRLQDLTMLATGTAVAGERVRCLKAESITHSDTGWSPRTSPVAQAVRRAIHGHV